MNYIRHLNAFFTSIKQDNRLTASHVSLYLALFQYWNFNRFQNPFPIYRTDIMNLCKIGSKNTYHKCIKELHHCSYIIYHPASSKYQPVKISMIRLDKQIPKDPTQLDLFNPNIDTQHVPILTDTSTDINTTQVPKMGQLIKPNSKQERETPAQQIFKKNKKIQTAINDMAQVSNSVHVLPSALAEVQEYFQQHNHSSEEATKFYNHYKSLGWKIQGKTPIEDWKPLVEKWMTNAKRWDTSNNSVIATKEAISNSSTELQYLYESFLDGKKIFQHITTQHFEQLNLSLDDQTMLQATQQRLKVMEGSNQYSIGQIWQAYLTNDPNNPLIQKDQPNLIALAKRIAVINHFQQCKHRNIQQLTLPP